MSVLSIVARQDFIGRKHQPITGPETGIGDVISASYRRHNIAFANVSKGIAYGETLQPIIDKVEELTGQSFVNPANFLAPSDAPGHGQKRFTHALDSLNKVITENNLGLTLHSEKTLAAAAKIQVAEAERDYQDVLSRAGGLRYSFSTPWGTTMEGTTTGLAGDITGALPSFFADAVEAPGGAMLALTGAKYKAGRLALLRVGLIDAGIAAGVETALQPGIYEWRNKNDLKYDLGDALTVIAGAGVGGGVLRMLGSGAMVGAKSIRDKTKLASQADAEQVARNVLSLNEEQLAAGIRAYERAGAEIPSDVRGAAQSVENATETPYVDAPGLHEQNLDLATRALAEDSRLEVAPGEVKPIELDNLDGTVFRVDPREIEVDAKLFQFRSVVDEFGVGERLQNMTKWDDEASGIVQIYEYKDGRQFIVDGHQRLGLAKRIMANDPSQQITLYARKYREADGMTPQDAMIKASLINIGNTVEGSPQMIIDAAKILRIAPDELRGVLPPQAPFVRAANNIAALSDDAFMMVINDVVPVNQAAIIGRLVDDPEKHTAIMQILSETSPSNLTQAEAIIRQARELEFRREKQDTLFGEEFLLESLFKERAKVLDKAIATLRKDRAVFNTLVKNEESIEASGNQLSTSTNQQRATTDGQALQIIQATANRKGALSDALTAAAEVYRDGGNLAAASREFADAVRRGIERGDLDGMGASAEGRTFDDPATQLAARATLESLDAFDAPAGKGVEAQAALLQEEVLGASAARETDAGLAKETLDLEVPTGRYTPDGDPETVTGRQLLDEIEQDQSMLDRLEGCV